VRCRGFDPLTKFLRGPYPRNSPFPLMDTPLAYRSEILSVRESERDIQRERERERLLQTSIDGASVSKTTTQVESPCTRPVRAPSVAPRSYHPIPGPPRWRLDDFKRRMDVEIGLSLTPSCMKKNRILHGDKMTRHSILLTLQLLPLYIHS